MPLTGFSVAVWIEAVTLPAASNNRIFLVWLSSTANRPSPSTATPWLTWACTNPVVTFRLFRSSEVIPPWARNKVPLRESTRP